MRINDSERAELAVLAARPAKNALARMRELHNEGHKFEDMQSSRAFATAANGTYREVTSSYGADAVPNYGKVFGNDTRWGVKILYGDLDGYEDLLDYVKARPALVDFLTISGDESSSRDHILRVDVGKLPVIAAENHIYTAGWELDEALLNDEIEKLVMWWAYEDVPIEILVPILNIAFETDRFPLGDNIWIERMDEGLQLARWPGQPRANKYQDILPMATHALVLAGWTLSSSSALGWLRYPDDEPIDVPVVEQFFQALAATVAAPTGYVQVVYRAVGWAHRVGPLPEIIDGPLVEHYSTALTPEKEPQANVDAEDIEVLQSNFASLTTGDAAVTIAGQRLLDAERRKSDVDRILDLCIGIEALVAGQPGDATYKVTVRVAAVLADLGISNSLEIMEAAKTVYAFRSAVVHGRGKLAKASHVLLGGEQMTTIDAARYILRNLLSARLRQPSLTTDDIDTRIVAGALAGWAANHAATGT